MKTPRVVLKPRRAQPFFGPHPWVFAGAIAAVAGSPADGDEVELYSHGGSFIARGLFNSQSKIRVRLYQWAPEQPLDQAFFRARIADAIRLRERLGLMGPGTACRLIFSEGDRLSGLTVDRFDRFLTMQLTSLGLALRRDMLADILTELTGAEGIYLRTERGVGKLEGVELHDSLLRGHEPPSPLVIEEPGGVRFEVNVIEGQKTGFYLDQRSNRQLAAKYAAGRSILDAFCYTGGFALHGRAAGAIQVEGVDASGPALELARANASRNGFTDLKFTQADVFDDLAERVAQGQKFGLVILDPPKFARAKHAIPEALRGYRRLQSLALQLLEPEGILVMCCCSGLIAMESLEELLAQVAADTRRDVQILERGGQAPDHPVSVACLESNYLKCLICRVL